MSDLADRPGSVSIPEEAIAAACFELNEYASGPREHFRERWGDQAELALGAAAPLIVARELIRLAEEESVGVNEDGHRWRAVSTEDLLIRAEELREAAASVLRGEGQT